MIKMIRILSVFAVVFLFFASALQIRAAESQKAPELLKEIVLELPLGENNPRNSEGDFLRLEDGRVLFVYTKYYGASDADHAPAVLASRISADQGKTWSPSDQVVVENEGGQNVMSVTLRRLKNGRILLFYLRKNSSNDCRPCVRFSDDDGRSWSEPILCIGEEELGYYVLNNDRVLQQDEGTLLMPLAFHGNESGQFRPGARIFIYRSTDHGKSWARFAEVPNPGNHVLQEPGLVVLKDGRILVYLRSNAKHQLYAFSEDAGKTWSVPEPSPLVSPLSPAVLKRIPDSDNLLAIWNRSPSERNPMSIAILAPDAKEILYEKTLDFSEDNTRWFCYPALHFLDKDRFLVSYCAGEKRNWGLNHTRMIRSSVENVKAEP